MWLVESESGAGFLRKGLSSENREAAVLCSGAVLNSLVKMLEGDETVSVGGSLDFFLPIGELEIDGGAVPRNRLRELF